MNEIKIEKMDHQGRGIGYVNGKVTFIKNALPGEIVLEKIVKETKNYSVAEVVEYKKKNHYRMEPFCPYFAICGGCDLEHMRYEDTLNYKKEKVENILTKEKIIFPSIEVIENPSPKHYRNKLSLKIENNKIGFYESSSHTLIEIKTCPLAKKSINICLKELKKLQIKKGSITIRSNYNDEILLIIKTNEKVHFSKEIFLESKIVGIVLNDKTIYGQNFFYERMNGFLFKVSYDAFFQVNLYITSKMFQLVSENIKNNSVVLDLFSGVGTLGIIASKKAKKVYSIEIVQNAVLDNVENKKVNQCENVFPMLGDAFNTISKIKESFDMILIDPPRSGLSKATCEFLLESNAQEVLYISCNPLTLARDLGVLTTKYELKRCLIMDMFSYTHHVESFVVLERKKEERSSIS